MELLRYLYFIVYIIYVDTERNISKARESQKHCEVFPCFSSS